MMNPRFRTLVSGDRHASIHLLILLLLVGTTACAAPSAFRPAKTVGAGRFEHAIGFQVTSPVHLNGPDAAWSENLPGRSFWSPMTPTYALRLGLTDRLQIGGQLGLPYARGEAQFQFLESRFLDLALGADIGFGASPLSKPGQRGYHALGALPLIVGVNPFPFLSVVAQVGPASWGVEGLQFGGGIDLELPLVSLRPHVAFFEPFGDPVLNEVRDPPFILFGLDLAFGG